MASRHLTSHPGTARRPRRPRGIPSMTERQLQAYLLARETLRGIQGALRQRAGPDGTSARAP